LVGASEYLFGTKVLAGDSDIGRPLFAMPPGTDICFWDTGTPGYDHDDVVYLTVPPKSNVKEYDIRLTPVGDHPEGSKVNRLDNDIGMPLKTFKGSAICYLNLYNSLNYDLADPVYFHQSATVYSIVNDVRLNTTPLIEFTTGNEFKPGTKIEDFDLDLNKYFGTLPSKLVKLPLPNGSSVLGFFDENGNGVYDFKDDVYMNYPQGVPKGSVAVNNIRLSAPQ
jgi:hypothetical protein